MVLYVCLGHVWALTIGCDVFISRRKESATTLETLTGQARFGKLENVEPLSLASYVMPHHDDGPQVFLSGIVCLFGSCIWALTRVRCDYFT